MSQEQNATPDNDSRISRLIAWSKRAYSYCSEGVWRDTRKSWRVKAVKIANLSVKGFLNSDLQTQACAMTFRMLLAIVPALALILAIATGFGFQNLLKEELYSYFPSQHTALEAAFGFVDSYLSQASEGLFVGVGIVFLLWTLISLLMSVEDAFNVIWHVQGRTMWRKATDYIAILLVLPVLMICSAGLSLLMSTTLRSIFDVDILRPAVEWLLDLGSLVFTALFFTEHKGKISERVRNWLLRGDSLSGTSMAIRHRSDVCDTLQCHLWQFLVLAASSHLVAACVHYNTDRSTAVLCVTKRRSIQFLYRRREYLQGL